MRLGIPTLMWIGAMLFATYGCAGRSSGTTGTSGTTAPESTSGGEAAVPVAGDTSLETATPSAAERAWGATRAEQCRREARPLMSSKARRAFDNGVRYASANNIAAAETSFQASLNKDPNAYPALYNLGVLADRRGDQGEAMNYYRRALRVVADYEPAARGISTNQIRQNQVRAAVATVEPLANEYRANLEMQALYAEVLVHAKRLDEAWMAARRALKCDERFVPALIALVKASRAQGRDELADSILAQAMEVDRNVAELHFLQGERLAAEPGQLREAMAAYERAIQLRPNYAEARMALGIQLLAGGNYPGALSHFQAAERLVPTLPEVHVNLGDAYRAIRRWTDAQRAYRQALDLRSNLPEAHYGLGLLFLTAAGDFPGHDELTAFEKAVKEFKSYRGQMGPRLAKDDQSEEYLRNLDRMIKRARRRIESEQGGTS